MPLQIPNTERTNPMKNSPESSFTNNINNMSPTPSNPMRTLTNSGKRKPVRSIQRVAIGVMTMASSDKASMTMPAIPDVVPMTLCKNGWKLSETAKKITVERIY